jgi:hypothetical protein
MKSEARHKLETNVLAAKLAQWGERLRPHASTIMTVAAVALAAYFLLSMWRGSGSRRDREAWDQYELAILGGDLELTQLQRVAASDDYAGANMQEWAYVAWADRQLRLAADRYLTDRDDANKRLTNIAGIYDELAANAGAAEVRNRARLGLARVNEMQNRLDEARTHYAQVEGALAPLATERIKALESKEAQEACEWLATADLPKPRAASGPGTPGVRPGFDVATPAADPDPTGDAGKSLEDILGGLTGELEPGQRYGEAPASAPGEEPAAPAESDPAAPPAESAAGEESSNEDGAPSDESPSGGATPAESTVPPAEAAAEEAPAKQ